MVFVSLFVLNEMNREIMFYNVFFFFFWLSLSLPPDEIYLPDFFTLSYFGFILLHGKVSVVYNLFGKHEFFKQKSNKLYVLFSRYMQSLSV